MSRWLYFLIGFVGLGGQVLLIRCALTTFTGNELTVCVLLASWTAWTGAGSWLGGRLSGRFKNSRTFFQMLLLILFILLPTTYVILYLVKAILGIGVAESVGPFKMVIVSLVVTAPLCLVLGALFPVAARIGDRAQQAAPPHGTCEEFKVSQSCHSERSETERRISLYMPPKRDSSLRFTALRMTRSASAIFSQPHVEAGIAVGRVYMWEALGAGIGGLVASAVLVALFRPLAAVFALDAIGAAIIAASDKSARRYAWMFAALLALVGAIFPVPDNAIKAVRWKNIPVIAEKDSRYARLTLVRREDESTLFVDGFPSMTWPAGAQSEELAHLAMLAHPRPENVLLIGGGLSQVGVEILKYPVKRLDYCQLDPAIIEFEKRMSGEIFRDPRIVVHLTDGRRFINEARSNSYDVIILAAGDPQTLAINRYYTKEFFASAARALKNPGVLCFATGEYANYIGPLLARYLSSERATLKSAFDNIAIYPLSRFYFVGGVGITPPAPQYFPRALEQKGIKTRWFRPETLAADLSADRINSTRQVIESTIDTRMNSDFHSLGYAYFSAYWSTRFSEAERSAMDKMLKLSPWNALWALAIFVILSTIVARGKSGVVAPAVMAMGFAEMVFSVAVLYASEVRLGTLFSMMGYLITALMAGLGIGAFIASRIPLRMLARAFKIALASLVLVLLITIPALSVVLKSVGDCAAIMLLTAMSLTGSAASGAIYALAARLDAEKDRADRLGGRINMADLVGAAAGALLAGSIMLPLWGFSTAIIISVAAVAAGTLPQLARR